MASTKLDPKTIALKATELFVRRGYSNTSMAEIGQSCGILKGSLYHHFESKESILLYILQSLQSDLRNHVFAIADDINLSAFERLKRINGFLRDYFLDQKACLVAIMGMEIEVISNEARAVMNGIFMDWKSTYIKLFKHYHTPYMADIHATNSIIFIEGAIIWMRVTQEEEPLKRVFKNIEKQMLPEDVVKSSENNKNKTRRKSSKKAGKKKKAAKKR